MGIEDVAPAIVLKRDGIIALLRGDLEPSSGDCDEAPLTTSCQEEVEQGPVVVYTSIEENGDGRFMRRRTDRALDCLHLRQDADGLHPGHDRAFSVDLDAVAGWLREPTPRRGGDYLLRLADNL